MTALADAHIQAQARLRRVTEQAVGQVWRMLPAYDEQQVPVFTSTAGGLVAAAQQQSVALTTAYLTRAIGARPAAADLAAILAQSRNGAAPDEVYRRPFVTVWTALRDGRDWQAAVNAGLARATSTASTDVQLAMRQTLVDVGERTDDIVGYQRVADAGACEFCQLVAGQRYTTAELMPIHNHCGCGVDVITRADRGEFSGKAENDLAGVAVHEHGELGPVLGDPAHDFTSEIDL